MPSERHLLRVGVIDSLVDAKTAGVRAIADFSTGHAESPGSRLAPHGQQVIAIIAGDGQSVEVSVAAVFNRSLVCSAAQVAEAVDWLCARSVRLINMSFGLREDRTVLREACARAIDQGVCLVAASPAQGAPCFPARYPGVLRATGDARCSPGELSYLQTAQADFGAYAGDPKAGLAGASCGCAHVSREAVEALRQRPGLSPQALYHTLVQRARYRGRERRASMQAGAAGKAR